MNNCQHAAHCTNHKNSWLLFNGAPVKVSRKHHSDSPQGEALEVRTLVPRQLPIHKRVPVKPCSAPSWGRGAK